MKRVTLSKRFGLIKSVTVDSTESETDFSDTDLIPRNSPNVFNTSNTASVSFAGNAVHKTADEGLDDEDSDDEMHDMERGWVEHFQKILLKSRNLSGEHEVHASLCDKVPEVDNKLPLQCLKNSLDQYNKLSQGSDIVIDDLTIDDLTIERNETGIDISEDDGAGDISNEFGVGTDEINDKKLKEGLVDKVAVNINIHVDPTEVSDITENVELSFGDNETDIVETATVDEIIPINNLNCGATSDEDIVSIESTQTDTKPKFNVKELNYENSGSKGENEVNIGKENVSNEDDTVVENVEIALESNKEDAGKTNLVHPSNALSFNKHESELDLSKCLPKDTNNTDKLKTKKSSISEVGDDNGFETVQTAVVNEDHGSKELNPDEICSTKSPNEKESDLKEKEISVKLSFPNKDKGKAHNEKCETLTDTNLKNASLKCNKDKSKSTKGSQSKKEPKKVKSVDIKPVFSFPLDELLPPLPTKKRKANEGTESAFYDDFLARKRHTSETNESNEIATPKETDSYNPVTPHPFNENDIFHGTVYDSSPKEDLDLRETLHQQSNFEDVNRVPLSGISAIEPYEHGFDSGMTNLISALQNGNQQVISMFQAALQDQIGSNLEALAFKARQEQQITPQSEKAQSFGFYTERNESDIPKPGETGDNINDEKYDELLDLFMAQCSELVKTDEDRDKLRSLMKVLQKEGEMKLTRTGFTPPPEIKPDNHHDKPDTINHNAVPAQLDRSKVEDRLAQTEPELFEGRTLLKGGVEPRHIPKTTVRKPGQELSKDPRPRLIGEKCHPQVKLPLPEFAINLYGEKRVKKMLHLDWDAQFSNSKTPLVLSREKDPRVKISPIDKNLKLIVDATKTLVETLNSSIENKTVPENKTVLSEKIAVVRDEIMTPGNVQGKNSEIDKTKTIPVLITQKNEMIKTKALDSSKNWHSALHCIDLKNSLSDEPDKQEKKLCIGIVKPLIEHNKQKDIKPSVGIVKPIQLQTLTENKRNTFTTGVAGLKLGKTGDGKTSAEKDKNLKTVKDGVNSPILVLDSNSEEGVKTKCESGSCTETMNITLSDVSSCEDGQIDTDLDKSFKEDVPLVKIDRRDKAKDRSGRCYRRRDRSSSRSSLESRVSYSSQTHFNDEDRNYNTHKSTRNGNSRERSGGRGDGRKDSAIKGNTRENSMVKRDKRENLVRRGDSRENSIRRGDSRKNSARRGDSKEKSAKRSNSREQPDKRDSSQSRDRIRSRSRSKDRHSKHRHRHRTSNDERSYKDFSNKSETFKRHHSVGDEKHKRKRHRTDEESATVKSNLSQFSGDIYSTSLTSPNATSVYGEPLTNKSHTQSSNLPQTNSVLFQSIDNEHNLTDADISKEYHEKFGKLKNSAVDTSDRLIFNDRSDNSLSEKQPQYDIVAEKPLPCFFPSKPRRKSWEDQQKQVLEDKKFLERYKKKILGTQIYSGKQEESAVCKQKPTSSTSLIRDRKKLEDGEI